MFLSKPGQSEETWMSASDLMTVLMILFLLIAIFYTIQKSQEADEITKSAEALIRTEQELCKQIREKFSDLIANKKIEVRCSPITVTFVHPEYKFAANECVLPVPFRQTLDFFFPVLINLIHSKNKYVLALEEVRIEGHTSSEWGSGKSKVDDMGSFKNNMKLSQCRAREVVKYSLGLEPITGDDPKKENLYKARKKWAFHNLTANGLSFARPIRLEDYQEDKEASRRVEFKLVTNTRDIIKGLKAKRSAGEAEQ
jgi:outer membrane protein OmpA-like peptidoglycan-associated protein